MDSLQALLKQLFDVDGLVQWGGVLGITTIVFVETGLFFGFFLPGDSLLVTAGIIAAEGSLDIGWLLVLPAIAAVVGDQVGYIIGRRAGSALRQRYSRFNVHLERAHTFYEKYGAKTIVIARFVPVVRTFVPAVAGAARMSYPTFVTYNILGGLLWVWGMTIAGYTVGKVIPNIKDYLHVVIVIVVGLSLLPAILEWRKHRKA